MASPELVEMTNNLPNDLAESITDGPWDIANYHECLFLLIYCQWCHTGRCTSCPILAIFNQLTYDLERTHTRPIGVIVLVLPFCMMALAMANFCFLEEPLWCYLSVCRCSRLVCGVTFSMPGMGNDKYVIHTLVHSTGSGANGVFLLLPVAPTNPLVCYQIVLMMCH
jgi:hypothetical protein